MPDLPDLIARVESAPPEMERELLEEARELLWGFHSIKDGTDPDTWVKRSNAFTRKLDAGAGLCAAMMLVPEDLVWGIGYDAGDYMAVLAKPKAPKPLADAEASTPALAVLLAVLLAARLKQEMG